MKPLRILGGVGLCLAIFGVFSHMLSLFVIGSVYIVWLLISYVATSEEATAIAGAAAVLAGYIVGRTTDLALRAKHQPAR